MLRAHGKLAEINQHLAPIHQLRPEEPCDNVDVRNLDVKTMLQPLYLKDGLAVIPTDESGVDYNKLSAIIVEIPVNEISNDTALADGSSTAIATENAIKQYFIDTGIVDKNTYNRKSFVHTGSFTSANTSSFTAVTASAPTGLSGTTEQDFMFFINGMLIENDALTINQKTSTNLELRLDTSGLGYELESDDEVIGFGKFNS